MFFGFARAAGETMAVQMVIGGARRIPGNLFQPDDDDLGADRHGHAEREAGDPASDALFSMSLILLVISVGVVLVTKTLSRTRRA